MQSASFWEILVAFCIFILPILILIVILRWVLRINQAIEQRDEIIQQLKTLNSQLKKHK